MNKTKLIRITKKLYDFLIKKNKNKESFEQTIWRLIK